MKNLFIILIFCSLIFSLPTFADELGTMNEMGDLMQYGNTFDNPFAGQKQVSDEEFQKTLSQVKLKKNKNKKGHPKQLKGKNNNDSDSSEYIKETDAKNLILSVPLILLNGDGVQIPMGHYKIKSDKQGEKVYLDFYQSSKLIAKVPAIETKSDFDEKEINFVKLIPFNEQRVKIIFGTMDLNAYTFINIQK